jgi:hypothetical protein
VRAGHGRLPCGLDVETGKAGKKRKKMREEKGKEVGQLDALGPNRLGSFSIFKTFYKL